MKMKRYVKITIILSIIFICTLSMNYYSFCEDIQGKDQQKQEQIDIKKQEEDILDTDITSDNFIDSLDPSKMESNSSGAKLSKPLVKFIKQIVQPILGFIQTIGGFLMIVALAMFGLGMLLSSNAELAEEFPITITPSGVKNMVKYGRQLLIGTVLLFFSTTLVKFVFQIFNI